VIRHSGGSAVGVSALVGGIRRLGVQPDHAAGDGGAQAGRVADEAGGAFLVGIPARMMTSKASSARRMMITARPKPMRMVLMEGSVRRRVRTPLLREWTGERRPG
jgi:hypothetical protein